MSKSSFYEWLKEKPNPRTVRDNELKEHIEKVYFKAKQRYGSPRVTAELNAQNIKVSRPKVAKMMRQLGLRSKIGKKFVATTDSKHNYAVVENLLNRNFYPEGPSQVWVSDITYIHTLEGFIYLTTIIDLFDRKVIGWAISEGMSAKETSLAAWNMAVKNRELAVNMIFHSDRGVQYASNAFANTMQANKVRRSMSRKGNCWDNSVAESFFKSLKTEAIYGNKRLSKQETRLLLFEYIEIWYNKNRRHSTLNYMTIEEFENANQKILNVA